MASQDREAKKKGSSEFWNGVLAAVVGAVVAGGAALWGQYAQLASHDKEVRRTEGLAAISRFLNTCDARIAGLAEAEARLRQVIAAGTTAIPFVLSDLQTRSNEANIAADRSKQALGLARTLAALTVGESRPAAETDRSIGGVQSNDFKGMTQAADLMGATKADLGTTCPAFAERLMEKIK